LTPEQLADAARSADILVPTVTDVITEELLKAAGLQAEADPPISATASTISMSSQPMRAASPLQYAEGFD